MQYTMCLTTILTNTLQVRGLIVVRNTRVQAYN